MPRSLPRDLAKERRWRRLVQQCQRSGLSVRAFCDQQDLSEQSFYWWRRALAQRDAAASGPAAEATPAAPRFVPVHVRPDEPLTADSVEVLLANGRRLRAGADIPPQRLAALVAALEAAAC